MKVPYPSRGDKKGWAAYMREYYRTHPEYAAKVRAAAKARHRRLIEDPEWRERERERGRRKARKARAQGKLKRVPQLKQIARTAVGNAVRDGKLIRPVKCERCKRSDVGRIHAHHKDYRRPFDVQWLCSLCHGKQHRKEDLLK